MSRGTKSFRTQSGKVFNVNRELLGSDLVVERFFRDLFAKPGCFHISLDYTASEPVLVIGAEKFKKGWTINQFELRALKNNGEVTELSFCEKTERTSIFFPANDVFQGVKFLISGRGQRWYKKEILQSFLKLSHGEVCPTVKTNVDFLVLCRANLQQENAKIAYAEKHGINVISPRELMAIWFSEFSSKYPDELKPFLSR